MINNIQQRDGTVDRLIQVSGHSMITDELKAKIMTQGGKIAVQSEINGIQVDRSTLDRLPSSVRGILNDFKELNCQGHLTLSASKQNSEPWNFDIRTTVDDGASITPCYPNHSVIYVACSP